MNRKILYLVLCVLGFARPYSQFVPWVVEHGLDMQLFVQQLFANRVGGFFGMDVLASAVTLISFISSEGARLKMRTLWVPIVSVLLVGVSLGLPLFLSSRTRVGKTHVAGGLAHLPPSAGGASPAPTRLATSGV